MHKESESGSDDRYRRLREAWTGTPEERPCSHLDQVQNVTPSNTEVCAECAAIGDSWIHLRICLICGYVGCCDQAKNHHMLDHVQDTGHPVIQSFETGEDWIWCYDDEALLAPPEWLGALSDLRTK